MAQQSPQTAWLADAPVPVLQQALKDLERADGNCFAQRAAFPRLKKKGRSESFRYPDPKQIKLDQANSREVLGALKNVTVSARGGKWFVSIQTEREGADPVHPPTSLLGVDRGVANFAALSTGEIIAPVAALKRHTQRLARYQRAMSRKQKCSRNWITARARVQKLHTRIGNIRRDHRHKLSTTLSQNHAGLVIEDVQVRNLSRSASGTIEQPGRNIRAKAGLNRSLLDQGWFEFRRQLEYKPGWRGGMVVAVDPRNTSRTCPACGHAAKENRPTQPFQGNFSISQGK
jgi:putative transposase